MCSFSFGEPDPGRCKAYMLKSNIVHCSVVALAKMRISYGDLLIYQFIDASAVY